MSEEAIRYILDANIFIEAARRYYAFDIAPPFWDALLRQAELGRITSIDRVKAELARGSDGLATWAKSDFAPWFEATDKSDVIENYANVIRWAASQDQFSDAAKAELANADNADAWLVAFATARKRVLVTHEEYSPTCRKKIPLPNVCRAFNVTYLNTFELLRVLGVRLG